MKTRRNAELVKAFTASSTDEMHHCENGFESVDRVALSTNRLYMIDSLYAGDMVENLDGLYDFGDSRLNEIIRERGLELGLREGAFVSFFWHCKSHLIQSRALRAAYLVKAMSKVLSEDQFADCVDALDSRLAYAYETIAYDAQMHSYWSQYQSPTIPDELETAVLEYLGMDEEELWAERNRSVDLILSREASLLRSNGSNSYSQFISGVFVPTLTEMLGSDVDERLSKFSLGIVSVFEPIPPQTYFVRDIETLSRKRLGHCSCSLVKDLAPTVDDILIVPRKEIEHAINEGLPWQVIDPITIDLAAYPFIQENYVKELPEFSAGLQYQVAVSQLWRRALHDIRACSNGPWRCNARERFQCQRAIYRKIRNFLLSAPDRRQRVTRAYVDLLGRRLRRRLFPWTAGIKIAGGNKNITKLVSYASNERLALDAFLKEPIRSSTA